MLVRLFCFCRLSLTFEQKHIYIFAKNIRAGTAKRRQEYSRRVNFRFNVGLQASYLNSQLSDKF